MVGQPFLKRWVQAYVDRVVFSKSCILNISYILKGYVHGFEHFTKIKNKYFIMYLFNSHRSFLHLLSKLQQ